MRIVQRLRKPPKSWIVFGVSMAVTPVPRVNQCAETTTIALAAAMFRPAAAVRGYRCYLPARSSGCRGLKQRWHSGTGHGDILKQRNCDAFTLRVLRQDKLR